MNEPTTKHTATEGQDRANSLPPTTGRLRLLFLSLVVCLFCWQASEFLSNHRPRIGGTAFVEESSTGLVFHALVDTGAGRCSINCLEIEIEDESESPEQNIGKDARVLVANEQGEQAWIETKLIDYSHIRNVEASKPRYHINLTLVAQGLQREVSATLKDRSHMTYPLLIGRNLLKDEFVVDVSWNSPDFPRSQQMK